MLRQRLRNRTSSLSILGRALVALIAAAVVYYAAMLLLLALKVSPATVDAISGYRSVFDELADLAPDDATSTVRLIAGLAGAVGFCVFGWLAYKELPRPYLARGSIGLSENGGGSVRVQPRALERIGEVAAREHPHVSEARGRVDGDGLVVEITLSRATEVHAALHAVQRGVAEAVSTHHLPTRPVAVTLTGFDRRNRRELR